MVKKAFPPRDIEQLSAYLDNQLPLAQRARLEARLRSDPGLQVELEGLRRTRLMLRRLPHRRAPRNFTLTPAMVGVSRPRPWPAVFGMASAVAAALLVLVLLSDFLFVPGYVGMFPVSQAPAQFENPSLAQESAKEAAPTAGDDVLIFPTEAPTLTLEPPSAKALPAGLPTATPQATLEEGVMADSLPAPSPDARAMLEVSPAAAATPPAESLLAQSPAISNSLAVTDTQIVSPTMTIQESPETAMGETGATEVAAAQEAGQVGLVGQGEAEHPLEPLWMQVIFWMVELLLACLAVASALLSVYLWYTSRR